MTDEAQDNRGELAPFQIKAFSVAVRKRIVAAAGNEGTTVGEWVEQAAMNQLERERRQVVLPPQPPTVEADELPDGPSFPQPSVYLDMAGLAQLLNALGDKAPDTLRRDAVASTRAVLRQVRGLPPARVRSNRRQTLRLELDEDDPAPLPGP